MGAAFHGVMRRHPILRENIYAPGSVFMLEGLAMYGAVNGELNMGKRASGQ